MPFSIDDQICEIRIDNVRIGVCHEGNVLNDATTLVVKLPERFPCDKKPSLGQADGKLKELQELNPQFNIDEFKLNPMTVLGLFT